MKVFLYFIRKAGKVLKRVIPEGLIVDHRITKGIKVVILVVKVEV